MDVLRIDLWSDLVCPWCAIGKAHLDAALARFEHADRVEVHWRSFELDPGAPPTREEPYEELLGRRYGTGAGGGRALVGRISAAAERAGLPTRFDLARTANTFDAHRLLHLAGSQGRQAALAARLTTGFLSEGAVLSDPGVLVRLAGEAGLDPVEVEQVLAGDAWGEQVRADEAEAARREITAVPTFLLDGRAVVPGAQSADSLLATLRRTWERAAH